MSQANQINFYCSHESRIYAAHGFGRCEIPISNVVSPCRASDALDVSPRTVAEYSVTSSDPVTSRMTSRWTAPSILISYLWLGLMGEPAFIHWTLTFGRDSSHSNVAVPGSSVTTTFSSSRTNSIFSSAVHSNHCTCHKYPDY